MGRHGSESSAVLADSGSALVTERQEDEISHCAFECIARGFGAVYKVRLIRGEAKWHAGVG